ncbi:MAG: hypothetical protein QG656_684 [Candidatus Hydrogenedentes bacterium]|nr:hypothetical protein [Candidatus Hydrogenedentota bacterium]
MTTNHSRSGTAGRVSCTRARTVARAAEYGAWFLICLSAVCSIACQREAKRPDNLKKGDYSYIQQRVSEIIQPIIAKYPYICSTIAIVDGQEIAWVQGFGVENEISKKPADGETIYRAGSFTKPVTAAAVMKMDELGLVDIDQPFQQYAPDFSIRSRFPDAPPFTLRQMMSHHSGLPSNYLKGQFRTQAMTQAELIAGLKEESLNAPPGAVFAYSEVAMSLLGYAIEQVTGEDYGDYMAKAFFEPIGMKTASFNQTEAVRMRLPKAYREGIERVQLPTRDRSADGMYASVLDMAAFAKMIFAEGKVDGKPFLSPESVAELLRPQNEDVAADHGYLVGMDWMRSAPDLEYMGQVAYHSTETLGFSGFIAMALDHKIAVIVLKNSPGDSARKMAKLALELAVEDKTGLPAPSKNAPVAAEPSIQAIAAEAAAQSLKPKAEEPVLTVAPEYLETLPGYYSSMMGFLKVMRNGDGLQATAHGFTGDLVPKSEEGRFGIRYKLGGLITIPLSFLEDYGATFYMAGGRQMIMFHQGPDVTIGARVEPTPIPQAWIDRMGYYKVTNNEGDYEYVESVKIERDGDFLLFAVTITLFTEMAAQALLTPVSDTDAYIAGLGTRQGDRVWAETVDGVEHIHYSGYDFTPAPEPPKKKSLLDLL